MAQYACKLVTDNGETYVAYCSTLGQFISPPYISPECVAREIGYGSTAQDCVETASRHVHDMRPHVIHDATRLLAKLKTGRTLLSAEMELLNGVVDFIDATVAPHQWNYPEVDDELVLGKWIDELGLRDMFPDYTNYEITTDCALYPAIQEGPQRRRCPNSFFSPRKRPYVGQNKLAGRYVSRLAIIANFAGPSKKTPEQVVERFYRKLCGIEHYA